MSVRSSSIGDQPHALGDAEELARALGGRRPAVFTDYDGVLTPIVERPEDAIMSERMRTVVRDLAQRCPVCVISGRDRPVVQELMGVGDLVVAGSHGFDIWSPERGTLEHEAASGFEDLLEQVTGQLRRELGTVEGAVVEPKRASVAVHWRRVAPDERPGVEAVVRRVLGEHGDALKVTPGKMVAELQPNLDWNKGSAVLYLLDALELDGDEVVPLYLGDDVTDEDAFAALAGRGVGIFVGDADDPEVAGRTTAADFALGSVDEVERFLDALAR